jgi:hypothetical protein
MTKIIQAKNMTCAVKPAQAMNCHPCFLSEQIGISRGMTL